jgi:large subunit ribosomal protein L18
MSLQRKIKVGRRRRTLRVRSSIAQGRPRVSVFRSLNYIYAQLIDDSRQHTLASCSSRELPAGQSLDKKQQAFAVGQELARRAKALGVNEIVFDRGPFLYHGRVSALADGLRDGGLQI